jgi:hypothetical protein
VAWRRQHVEPHDGSHREGQVDGVRKTLTESFRYGPRTARIATQILAHNNDDPERIRIVVAVRTIQRLAGSHCYLVRTNAGKSNATRM